MRNPLRRRFVLKWKVRDDLTDPDEYGLDIARHWCTMQTPRKFYWRSSAERAGDAWLEKVRLVWRLVAALPEHRVDRYVEADIQEIES